MTIYRSSEIRNEEAEKPLLKDEYREDHEKINKYFSDELEGKHDDLKNQNLAKEIYNAKTNCEKNEIRK